MNVGAKPFIKWVGGKGQLLPTLDNLLPHPFENTTYIDPFVGGGAMLFYMVQKYNFKNIIINDVNEDLINCYTCIKTNVYAVINKLIEMESNYHDGRDTSDYYYFIRDEFNNCILTKETAIDKCAYFIFLNKTCFNGLYRVNSKGKFNASFNFTKSPQIYDERNLLACSEVLQNVTICCGDYSDVLKYANSDTFIYYDPPYRPLKKSDSVLYVKSLFNDTHQCDLAKKFTEMDGLGCKQMLSNSDPKNIDVGDDFFDNLYSDFNITRVSANRMINTNGTGRGSITEIVVRNYDE